MAEINYINGYEIADAQARENIDNIEETYATVAQLNTETTSRQNADNNLQSQINSLASGSPKGVYATTAALISADPETGVYIVTADGHIYSWTHGGDTPVDCGVYQSTGIADDSIVLKQLNNSIFGKSYTYEQSNVNNPRIKFSLTNSIAVSTITKIQIKFDMINYESRIDAFFSTFLEGGGLYGNVVFDKKLRDFIKTNNKKYAVDLSITNPTIPSVTNANQFSIGLTSTGSSNLWNFTISDVELYINDNRIYDFEVSAGQTTVTTTNGKINYLATKEYVDKSIDELDNPTKVEFELPFVNNLYVVKTNNDNKSTVPIFIDYLYDGSKERISFKNGNDRQYICEKLYTQNTDIENVKEKLDLESKYYDIEDVYFNKLSIKQAVPNGDINILIIGDSVTAGAGTDKTYYQFAMENFAKEDIDQNRTSNIKFLGNVQNKRATGTYKNVSYDKQVCACGVSGASLEWWLTNNDSPFVYNDGGTNRFSINKWLERYRTYDDSGNKLTLDSPSIGTQINSTNINNIIACTPNIIYLNLTHNGGNISQYETAIESIRAELPTCKIIIGVGMPLIGTWFPEKYENVDYLPCSLTHSIPNVNWGEGSQGKARVERMENFVTVESGGESANGQTYDQVYYMPQPVITPTDEAYDYVLVNSGFKDMREVSKLDQTPGVHPGTNTHEIWGYELYALLKFIQGVNNENVTNNFDEVPLYN